MRRGILSGLIIIILTGISYGQGDEEKGKLSCFVELNQFITGSGFASGTELNIKLDPDNKKNFAFGIFYDHEYKKITGISIHHEIALLREKAILGERIKPHLFYNFIYRKTTIPEVGPDLLSTGDLVTYTSLEHHIGIGMKINLFEDLYLDLDLGYGAYCGSIKKPTAFNPVTGEIKGSNGLGMIAQVGIGCHIF